jgi:hypothetical protein
MPAYAPRAIKYLPGEKCQRNSTSKSASIEKYNHARASSKSNFLPRGQKSSEKMSDEKIWRINTNQ